MQSGHYLPPFLVSRRAGFFALDAAGFFAAFLAAFAALRLAAFFFGFSAALAAALADLARLAVFAFAFDAVFEAAGFAEVSHPSKRRVVMRIDF